MISLINAGVFSNLLRKCTQILQNGTTDENRDENRNKITLADMETQNKQLDCVAPEI